MDSLVIELQSDATNPNISVSNLLRKAKIVAAKLNQTMFIKWIDEESTGYEPEKKLPPYRDIKGTIKAYSPHRGWEPIIFEDNDLAKQLATRGVTNSIVELEDLASSATKDNYSIDFTPAAAKSLVDALGGRTYVKYEVVHSEIIGIIDSVRNIVLDWALKLEQEGILGEGKTFTTPEKDKAQSTSNIYNVYTSQFTGTVGNLGSQRDFSFYSLYNPSVQEVADLIKQIRQFTPELGLSTENTQEMNSLLNSTESELQGGAITQTIKSRLSSVKAIVEGAAGGVVAQGIIALISRYTTGQ